MAAFVKCLCAALKARSCVMILMVGALALPSMTLAVEGGSSNWAMGSAGFGAGRIPDPGFHFVDLLWFMDISTDQDFTLGQNKVDRLDVDITVNFFLPTYAGRIDAWNARYKVLGVLPVVWLDGKYRVQNAPDVKGSENHKLGDPGIDMAIGWHQEDFLGTEGLSLDYAPGLLVTTPWGDYDKQEVLNAGKNRWTIQPNFSYTLFHEPTGIELSQRIMYAFNLENDETNYESGQELHFDWALGKQFGEGWQAGLFGFFYRQTTGDSGKGATLGSLKGKGWGVGPIVQYSGKIGDVPATAILRYQKVQQDKNRTDDDSLMFNFVLSF